MSGLNVIYVGIEVSPGCGGNTECGVGIPEESKRTLQLNFVFCFEG